MRARSRSLASYGTSRSAACREKAKISVAYPKVPPITNYLAGIAASRRWRTLATEKAEAEKPKRNRNHGQTIRVGHSATNARWRLKITVSREMGFFDESFHAVAGLALWLLVKLFEDLFKPFYVGFGLFQYRIPGDAGELPSHARKTSLASRSAGVGSM